MDGIEARGEGPNEFESENEMLRKAVVPAYSEPGGEKVCVNLVILTCLKHPSNDHTLLDLIPKLGREVPLVHEPIDVVSAYVSCISLCRDGNHRAYSAMRSRWEGGYVYARVIRIPRGIDLNGKL